MSTDDPKPRRLAPIGAAAENRPPSASSRASLSRGAVSLVAGSGPASTQETQAILHSRLRIFVVIGLAASSIFLAKDLVVIGDTASAHPWVDITLQAILVATNAVAMAILWSRRQLSLRALRIIEQIILSVTVAFFTWTHYVWCRRELPLLLAVPSRQREVLLLAADGIMLRWFGLLVGYGTLIPNTGRRCAFVVGLIALAPLAVTAGTSAWGAIPHLPDVLLEMAIVLALGAAIATYGSYRIEELRQEAFEARKVGQYQLKELLATGGMGEVYLAEHVLLQRPCALKLIRPEHVSDPKVLLRFQREVQATATLTHWNTIEIFDYGHTADGTFYYVMEYLPGLSLQELVQDYGPVSPERVVYLLRQVCGALREAHAIGLIHRDIKPGNIMTCERGKCYDVAKLLDFGLVREVGLKDAGELTQHGTVAGSPHYMSPEQARGKDNLDARSDIYSLGAVAYFLLTGQPAFVRDKPVEVLMAHVYEPVAPLTNLRRDVPADLQAVVMQCLEKDPARRYQTAEILEQALTQCQCASLWGWQQAARWWEMHVPREKTRVFK